MANNITYATLLQKKLDEVMVQQSLTGWMEGNAGQVIYTGGKEIKIPKLSMDGLGNYGRSGNAGFADGDIDLTYQTREMSQDRGRKFNLDRNDLDESGFILEAGSIMAEFQRTKVASELDAYRISKLAQTAITAGNVEYGYSATKSTALEKLKDTIVTIRENGFTGDLICHCTYGFKAMIEKGLTGQISPATLTLGGVSTEVPSVDGVPLVAMTSNKMYSKINLLDGKTAGQEVGGYAKATDGLDINFIVIAKEVPIAVSKTDNMRIFSPDINQLFDGWSMDYRKYHDIWVMDNKVKGIYVNIKDAQPTP